MRRVVISVLLVVAALFAAPAFTQDAPGTGIALSLAQWLEPWEGEAGGGWMYAPAGQAVKSPRPIVDRSAAVAPGVYDIYWNQNADLAPLLIAEDVAVSEGEVTNVRVATGLTFEAADWVEPRDAENGWLGAILPTSTSFDFVNMTRTGSSMFLPPGRYDLFYMQDETDDIPAIWLGTFDIEAPFGGLGFEVGADADGNIGVVRTLPGGPAEAAGVEAGDVLIAVDGIELTGLALEDAVALLRGDAGTDVVLTVSRGKGRALDLVVTRNLVEPAPIVRATSGVRLSLPAGVTIQPDGWWGVAFEGEGAGALINWSNGTATAPLLVGPAIYDVYWNPDGDGEAELVATGVAIAGELVEVTPATVNAK